MTVRLAALSACLALAACQTPGELKQMPDVRHDTIFNNRLTPEQMAGCLKRRHENVRSNITGSVAPVGNGAYELVLRSSERYTYGVYELGPGGRVEYWIDPRYTSEQPTLAVIGMLQACP